MTMTVGQEGEIRLPNELRVRYGLDPDTSVRLIETRSGILLVPESNAPMGAELAKELDDWQALAQDAWEMFPYADDSE